MRPPSRCTPAPRPSACPGQADWGRIAELRDAVPAEVPVLGNGDVFAAEDALAMVEEDRVRRRRGRPGLPGPAVAVRRARGRVRRPPGADPPTLGQVAGVMRRHVELLIAHHGERKGVRDARKHMSWYLHGFAVGSELRRELGMIDGLESLDALLARLDHDQPFPPEADGPRGRQGSPGHVTFLEGWLDDPEDATVPAAADVMNSGDWVPGRPALVVGTLLAAVLAGCGAVVPGQARVGLVPPSDRALIDTYVGAANRAGDAGPAAQTAFLRASQGSGVHCSSPTAASATSPCGPTSSAARCARPRLASPADRARDRGPGGAVYVVAAAVSVRRGSLEVREDVGSKHFVIRDGRVSGYAPCAD